MVNSIAEEAGSKPPTPRATKALRNVLEKRATIASLSARLFNDHGYHSTTMEHIAAAANLAKPTLYHYFSSKSQIVLFIHDEFMEILIEGHNARANHGMTPAQLLHGAMVDMLRLNETHPGHVRVFFEHFRELPEAELQTVSKKRDYMYARVRQIVRDGIDDHTFRSVDERIATMAVFGMCNWAYQWFRPGGGPLSYQQVANLFWDYIARGLLTEESSARRITAVTPPFTPT